MAVTIQVPWHNPHGHGEAWNELLAWTLETYGLNGGRWTYTPLRDFMHFHFSEEQDALMFQLKTAGQIVAHE